MTPTPDDPDRIKHDWRRRPRPVARLYALKHGARASDAFSSRAYLMALALVLARIEGQLSRPPVDPT